MITARFPFKKNIKYKIWNSRKIVESPDANAPSIRLVLEDHTTHPQILAKDTTAIGSATMCAGPAQVGGWVGGCVGAFVVRASN